MSPSTKTSACRRKLSWASALPISSPYLLMLAAIRAPPSAATLVTLATDYDGHVGKNSLKPLSVADSFAFHPLWAKAEKGRLAHTGPYRRVDLRLRESLILTSNLMHDFYTTLYLALECMGPRIVSTAGRTDRALIKSQGSPPSSSFWGSPPRSTPRSSTRKRTS